MRHFKMLLDDAPADGGNSTPPTENPPPPPAAALVMAGTISERETNLAAELAQERASHATTAAEKKEREIKIAELEDALRLARGERQPVRAAKGFMQAWLEGDENN